MDFSEIPEDVLCYKIFEYLTIEDIHPIRGRYKHIYDRTVEKLLSSVGGFRELFILSLKVNDDCLLRKVMCCQGSCDTLPLSANIAHKSGHNKYDIRITNNGNVPITKRSRQPITHKKEIESSRGQSTFSSFEGQILDDKSHTQARRRVTKERIPTVGLSKHLLDKRKSGLVTKHNNKRFIGRKPCISRIMPHFHKNPIVTGSTGHKRRISDLFHYKTNGMRLMNLRSQSIGKFGRFGSATNLRDRLLYSQKNMLSSRTCKNRFVSKTKSTSGTRFRCNSTLMDRTRPPMDGSSNIADKVKNSLRNSKLSYRFGRFGGKLAFGKYMLGYPKNRRVRKRGSVYTKNGSFKIRRLCDHECMYHKDRDLICRLSSHELFGKGSSDLDRHLHVLHHKRWDAMCPIRIKTNKVIDTNLVDSYFGNRYNEGYSDAGRRWNNPSKDRYLRDEYSKGVYFESGYSKGEYLRHGHLRYGYSKGGHLRYGYSKGGHLRYGYSKGGHLRYGYLKDEHSTRSKYDLSEDEYLPQTKSGGRHKHTFSDLRFSETIDIDELNTCDNTDYSTCGVYSELNRHHSHDSDRKYLGSDDIDSFVIYMKYDTQNMDIMDDHASERDHGYFLNRKRIGTSFHEKDTDRHHCHPYRTQADRSNIFDMVDISPETHHMDSSRSPSLDQKYTLSQIKCEHQTEHLGNGYHSIKPSDMKVSNFIQSTDNETLGVGVGNPTSSTSSKSTKKSLSDSTSRDMNKAYSDEFSGDVKGYPQIPSYISSIYTEESRKNLSHIFCQNVLGSSVVNVDSIVRRELSKILNGYIQNEDICKVSLIISSYDRMRLDRYQTWLEDHFDNLSNSSWYEDDETIDILSDRRITSVMNWKIASKLPFIANSSRYNLM